jgi:hypothetical protein
MHAGRIADVLKPGNDIGDRLLEDTGVAYVKCAPPALVQRPVLRKYECPTERREHGVGCKPMLGCAVSEVNLCPQPELGERR